MATDEMNARHGAVTRVELRYEDGTVRWLEGPSAQDFNQIVTDLCIFASIHGQSSELMLPWRETTVPHGKEE